MSTGCRRAFEWSSAIDPKRLDALRKGRKRATNCSRGGRSFFWPHPQYVASRSDRGSNVQSCDVASGRQAWFYFGSSSHPLIFRVMLPFITILNRCHRAGFVYQRACFPVPITKSIEVAVRPRKRSAAICSRCHPARAQVRINSPSAVSSSSLSGAFLFFCCTQCVASTAGAAEIVVVEEVPWGDGKRHADPRLHTVSGPLGAPTLMERNGGSLSHFMGKGFRCGVEHVVCLWAGTPRSGPDRRYRRGLKSSTPKGYGKYLTLVYQIDLPSPACSGWAKERAIESFRGFFITHRR